MTFKIQVAIVGNYGYTVKSLIIYKKYVFSNSALKFGNVEKFLQVISNPPNDSGLLTDDKAFLAQQIQEKLQQELENIISNDTMQAVTSTITSISQPTNFNFIPGQILKIFDEVEKTTNAEYLGKFCKLLIINLINLLPRTLSAKNIPDSILKLYPETLSIIIDTINELKDEDYHVRNASFLKDFRISSARSFPAGAQIFDVPTYIPNSVYRNRGYKNNLKSLAYVIFRLTGLKPLVRIHTDVRNLGDFNEQGWNKCYMRIAQFMQLNPEIKGMVGTSWFYDPQLENISPRLAYLLRVPLRHGAHLIIDGSSEIDIERATRTSKTRRALYEKGEYLPTCCTLMWSRKDLIKWAENYNH